MLCCKDKEPEKGSKGSKGAGGGLHSSDSRSDLRADGGGKAENLNKSENHLSKAAATANTTSSSGGGGGGGGGAKQAGAGNAAKQANRSSSANSGDMKQPNDNKASRSSSRQSNLDDDEYNKPHRYIIEATVLKDSWPLTTTQWNFVNLLKDNEVNELKVLELLLFFCTNLLYLFILVIKF